MNSKGLKNIIWVLVLFNSTYLFSQKKQPVDVQLVELGDEMYNFGDKKDAQDLYFQALLANANNLKANYMAGKCYLETHEKYKSVSYLLKAYEINKNVSPDILFKIANGYHYGAKFDSAIKYYTLHKERLTTAKIQSMNTSFIEEKAKCDKKIAECRNGKMYYAKPKHIEIENLSNPVNSNFPEYAPVINANQNIMVFTSRRDGGIGQFKDVDNEFFEDIWESKKVDGKWTKPKNIGKNINTISHDASIGFSADGKILFIYKPDNGGDIYFSNKLNDTTWSVPSNIGSNINSKYAEASVCISSNGRTLYFSSDRPGGFGKMDIYRSELLNDGKWGSPVNLGSNINTPQDDDSPFIDADGKNLYFSSRGHKNMGGYDIYKSTFNKNIGNWSNPENLGYPINSPDDDIYFVIASDGKTGYYASAKEGGFGENDIYSINMINFSDSLSPNTLNINRAKTTTDSSILYKTLKLAIKDFSSKTPLSANVKIIDAEQNKIVVDTNSSTNGLAEFRLLQSKNYAFEVLKKGYLFYDSQLKADKLKEMAIEVYLKKIEIGSKLILSNVFYDLGKAHLRDDSATELELLLDLLNKNPSLKIEIAGYTDNIGNSIDNKKLSTNRAKQVFEFLIQKGIPVERLRFAGYGSEKPVADNRTELGRQQNRRTELLVIGF